MSDEAVNEMLMEPKLKDIILKLENGKRIGDIANDIGISKNELLTQLIKKYKYVYDYEKNTIIKIDSYIYINKNNFINILIPYFNDLKLELLSILKRSYLSQIFKNVKLGMINNKECIYLFMKNSKEEYVYYENKKFEENKVLQWEKIESKSSQVWLRLRSIKENFKQMFLEKIVVKASSQNLVDYILGYILNNYKQVKCMKNDKYFQISYKNLKYGKASFLIYTYNVYIIIPCCEKLSANEIIDMKTENKKIIITNKMDIDNYTDFDHIISGNDIISYLTTMDFSHGISFYHEVSKLSYKKLFNIVDLLNNSSSTLIYEMKKELINLDCSDGKIFEKYLGKFLKMCFDKCYDNIKIKDQVPSEDSIRIRDFVIDNTGSYNNFLKKLERKKVEFLIFDAKNYEKRLTTRDLDTFRNYIYENPSFGKMGIILSRKGVNSNCKKNIINNLRSKLCTIIVLNENDLLKMLDYIEDNKCPIDIIQEKYNNLMLEL